MVDFQRGILGMQLAPHSSAQIVANAAALGARLKAAGALIVQVRVDWAPDGRDRLAQPTDAATLAASGGLPPGYADIAPEIAALGAEVAIIKRQWGAFHGTELDLQLRRRGIGTVVVCGIATNFGVESTVREAWQHNYAVIVAEDATSSISEDMHRFSVEKIMPRLARVRGCAEIAAAVATAP